MSIGALGASNKLQGSLQAAQEDPELARFIRLPQARSIVEGLLTLPDDIFIEALHAEHDQLKAGNVPAAVQPARSTASSIGMRPPPPPPPPPRSRSPSSELEPEADRPRPPKAARRPAPKKAKEAAALEVEVRMPALGLQDSPKAKKHAEPRRRRPPAVNAEPAVDAEPPPQPAPWPTKPRVPADVRLAQMGRIPKKKKPVIKPREPEAQSEAGAAVAPTSAPAPTSTPSSNQLPLPRPAQPPSLCDSRQITGTVSEAAGADVAPPSTPAASTPTPSSNPLSLPRPAQAPSLYDSRQITGTVSQAAPPRTKEATLQHRVFLPVHAEGAATNAGPLIIGKGGVNVKAITRKTGAWVTVNGVQRALTQHERNQHRMPYNCLVEARTRDELDAGVAEVERIVGTAKWLNTGYPAPHARNANDNRYAPYARPPPAAPRAQNDRPTPSQDFGPVAGPQQLQPFQGPYQPQFLGPPPSPPLPPGSPPPLPTGPPPPLPPGPPPALPYSPPPPAPGPSDPYPHGRSSSRQWDYDRPAYPGAGGRQQAGNWAQGGSSAHDGCSYDDGWGGR